jgi:GNAT superfamily N-acetyltransferase
MSLLIGDWRNAAFNTAFREYTLNRQQTRSHYEWMQAFPGEWDDVLTELFSDCLVKAADNTAGATDIIELNTRVNFKFNPARYAVFKQANPATGIKIVRTDAQLFEAMKGSVVPFYFWNNAADFCTHGVGFSVFDGDKLVSTAYSSTIHDRQIELGIETVAECRGKGFAQYACAALIDYCLENNYEPVWACRLENTGSYRLAQKLGFEHALSLPYYRLSK